MRKVQKIMWSNLIIEARGWGSRPVLYLYTLISECFMTARFLRIVRRSCVHSICLLTLCPLLLRVKKLYRCFYRCFYHIVTFPQKSIRAETVREPMKWERAEDEMLWLMHEWYNRVVCVHRITPVIIMCVCIYECVYIFV